MSELPKEWALATLGKICGQPEQRIPAVDEAFTYIDIASIDRDLKKVSNPIRLLGADAPSRARKVVEKGDVIVSMIRPNLNAVALIDAQHHGSIASTGFDVLKPCEVDPRWIFAAVRYSKFVDSMCNKVQGALYPAVKSTDIREHEIPVPPLAEQTHIAQKLDELQAQVDILKARIAAIPARLKRLRQSGLAAAVSGRLTKEWRGNSEGSPLSQPPLVFFERDQGPTPPGWRWEKLVSLTKLESGHTPRKSIPTYWENGDIPWISLQDIRAADGKEISETKHMPTMLGIEKSSARLLPKGTVCFSRDISVGFVTIMGRSMATSQHFANWICKSELLPKYLMYSFMTAREHLLQSGKGSTVKTIYMPALKELRLLLPPLSEQKEIIQRAEQFLAAADRLEVKVAMAKTRVDQLTQCILAKAFRGEFTADWREKNFSLISGEHSANALLEKIKNNRKEPPKQPRQKRSITKRGGPMKQQIIGVLDALKIAERPLTGQQLLIAAGYPLDSSTDQLEQFFLDIRSALAEKKVIKQPRDNEGQDWFTLRKPEQRDKDTE